MQCRDGNHHVGECGGGRLPEVIISVMVIVGWVLLVWHSCVQPWSRDSFLHCQIEAMCKLELSIPHVPFE